MNAEFDPEPIPVKVEKYAKKGNCYINVAEKVKKDGGKLQYGWVIWQSKYLIEAEHHAVWLNDAGEVQVEGEINGELIDITPREKVYVSVMFIPDSNAAYDGVTSIDNVMMNISGNPVIDDFIKLAKAKEALYRLGARINDDQVRLHPKVSELIRTTEIDAGQTEWFYLQGGKMDKECFCSLGKKYAECHHLRTADLPNVLEDAKKYALTK